MTRFFPGHKIKMPGKSGQALGYRKSLLTQSPLEQPRETSQEISNLLDVSWRTASSTPKAFYDELASDFSKHLPDVVTRVAEGAAIGIGTTLLLKIPKVAPAIGALSLLYTGYKAYTAGSGFVGHAAQADTLAQREAVARTSSRELGGTLSAFVESAPGMIAGGYGISKAFGAPKLYTRIGDAAREGYAFRGPGSISASSLVNEQGEFDGLSAAKMLAKRQPWQGVETGSTIDLNRLRVSRAISGESGVVTEVPYARGGNIVPFHTHGPEASAGFLPSNVDVKITPRLGILQQGDVTTFYVGQAKEVAALGASSRDYFLPSLRAVSVDAKTGLAQRFTGQWTPEAGLHLDKPVNLDLASALKVMGQLRASDPWSALSAIAAKTPG
jgi:hypothetical protein